MTTVAPRLVVAAPGSLDTAVDELVGQLLHGAPEALAITKTLARGLAALPLDKALEGMLQLSAERFASAEGQEGMRAFAEKRDPSWVQR